MMGSVRMCQVARPVLHLLPQGGEAGLEEAPRVPREAARDRALGGPQWGRVRHGLVPQHHMVARHGGMVLIMVVSLICEYTCQVFFFFTRGPNMWDQWEVTRVQTSPRQW